MKKTAYALIFFFEIACPVQAARQISVCVTEKGQLRATRYSDCPKRTIAVTKTTSAIATFGQAPRANGDLNVLDVANLTVQVVDADGMLVGYPVDFNGDADRARITVYSPEIDGVFDAYLNGADVLGDGSLFSVRCDNRADKATAIFESPDCSGQAWIAPTNGWSVMCTDDNAVSLGLHVPSQHVVTGADGSCLRTVHGVSRINALSALCEPMDANVSCVVPAFKWVPPTFKLPLRIEVSQ